MVVELDIVANAYLHRIGTVDEEKVVWSQAGVLCVVFVHWETKYVLALVGKHPYVNKESGLVNARLVKIHHQRVYKQSVFVPL